MNDLRIKLAEAKNALRDDKSMLEIQQAMAEYGATIIGKNADDRKREMAYILATNNAYQQALNRVIDSQNDVELLSAQVAAVEDQQTAQRISAVERLADALDRLARSKPVDSAIVGAAIDDWSRR